MRSAQVQKYSMALKIYICEKSVKKRRVGTTKQNQIWGKGLVCVSKGIGRVIDNT